MFKTPKQLAKNVCANFNSGQCVFGGACNIMTDMPCPYFRKSVLPQVGYRYCPEIKNLDELRYRYSRIDSDVEVTVKMRKCKCGNSLAKGKQLCADCRKRNRRKTWRNYKNNSRKRKAG